MSQRVNWVLDADIRSFFDSVDHEWLLRMVAHRTADPRILRLIRQWLEAGILESDEWYEVDRGTPQGAGISPLLANIFLHYVLDLWVHQWRHRHARGRVSIVRYADDFVMGFESMDDAPADNGRSQGSAGQVWLVAARGQDELIAFGRLPTMARQQRDERRPETFAFLGFTHYCGWTRDGRFIVKRKTQSTRLTRKLKALRQEAWRLMHAPIAEQQRRYASILRGHYAYYGLPHNWRALNGFRQNLLRIWFRCLRRRSQKGRRLGWARFNAMLERFPLPLPQITHPWAGPAA
jgi:RNA-directed DNA polymerase